MYELSFNYLFCYVCSLLLNAYYFRWTSFVLSTLLTYNCNLYRYLLWTNCARITTVVTWINMIYNQRWCIHIPVLSSLLKCRPNSCHPGQTRPISSHRHKVVVIQARLHPFLPIDITNNWVPSRSWAPRWEMSSRTWLDTRSIQARLDPFLPIDIKVVVIQARLHNRQLGAVK